jgi:benzodiazapine receptor
MKKPTLVFPLLPLFIIGSIALGSVGSIATIPAIPTWYAGLVKPSFNPPNWIFGPVWTMLFALMGIAAFLVWCEGVAKKPVRFAFGMFLFQFLLNILWSFAFFGANSPLLGLLVIIPLWIAIIVTTLLFYRIRKLSGYLFIPYVLWVSFAMILNASIYALNG